MKEDRRKFNRLNKTITPYGWRIESQRRRLEASKPVFISGWELSDRQAADMLVSPCRYCGEEPRLPYPGTLTIVDPALPYSLTNAVPCCLSCKNKKGDMSETEFLSWAQEVVRRLEEVQKKSFSCSTSQPTD